LTQASARSEFSEPSVAQTIVLNMATSFRVVRAMRPSFLDCAGKVNGTTPQAVGFLTQQSQALELVSRAFYAILSAGEQSGPTGYAS
jgi:hypothetical protein